MKRITKRLIEDVSGYWSEWQEWADGTIKIIAEAIGEVPDNVLIAVFCSESSIEVIIHDSNSSRSTSIEVSENDGGVVYVSRIDSATGSPSKKRTLDPIDWMRDEVAWVSGGTT